MDNSYSHNPFSRPYVYGLPTITEVPEPEPEPTPTQNQKSKPISNLKTKKSKNMKKGKKNKKSKFARKLNKISDEKVFKLWKAFINKQTIRLIKLKEELANC